MTERIWGSITRVQNEGRFIIICVWSGYHEVHLVIQNIFKSTLANEFYSNLPAVFGHLLCLQNLIAQMRSTGPSFWRSLDIFSLTTLTLIQLICFMQHSDEIKQNYLPSSPSRSFVCFWCTFIVDPSCCCIAARPQNIGGNTAFKAQWIIWPSLAFVSTARTS